MPGLCEVIRHEHNGLVCDVESPDSLAQAVARVASDPSLRDRLGANARDLVIREFDISTCTNRLQAFFAETEVQHASA
jgi:glycosyltransferase involved in cell wall biosynthesis